MPTVDELFSIRYGHGLSLNALQDVKAPAGVNFVSRSTANNGVRARIELPQGVIPGSAGEITVALNGEGGALASFLQPAPFVTGYHVAILTPRGDMTDPEKLWWARCIWENHYRYGFGRQANRTLGALVLPDYIPEWVMQSGLVALHDVTASVAPATSLPVVDAWSEYRLDAVFEISKGSRLTKRDQVPGTTPYIGSSALRNGVTNRISALPRFPGGVLTVPYNGSVGHAFYQPEPFCAGDDVHVLAPRDAVATAFSLMFIATVIRAEKYRYSYGRKWNLSRMEASTIALPSRPSDGRPDHSLMDRYMRGLPFAASVE